MFEATSRYAGIPTAQVIVPGPGGEPRTVTYVRRRFVPSPAGAPTVRHTVVAGDRLDLLAARAFGDPTQFWRICDVNRALHPADLVARAGAQVHVPQVGGL